MPGITVKSDLQKRVLASAETLAKYGRCASELASAALDDFSVGSCTCGNRNECPFNSLRSSIFFTKKCRVDFMADFVIWRVEYAAEVTECLQYLAGLLDTAFHAAEVDA